MAVMKPVNLSAEELAEKREQVRFITQNLEATYGLPQPHGLDDPLDELILTILSQSTTNINSDRAFASLKNRFPNWESARRARPASIAIAIKSGGLANVKSITIKNILNEVKRRRGDLNLHFLRDAPLAEARDFLVSLKGVGPKTAACVLLFSCHQAIFPMDTHIFRVTRRLGLVPERAGDDQAHALMDALVPAGKHYSLHVNLIRHGRALCRPQNPKCERCPLIDHCEFGQRRV